MKGFPFTALNVKFGPYQMIYMYSFQHLEPNRAPDILAFQNITRKILFSYGRQITVKLIMTMILSIYLCNLGQNVSLHDIRTK